MNKQTIITALFALVAMAGQAQATFDTDEGCLNVMRDSSTSSSVLDWELDIATIKNTSFLLFPFISAHTISFLTSVFRLLSISVSEDSLCLTRRMLELTRNIPFPKIIRILAFIYHPALALKCILHQI